jgi:hypothetical protein
LAYVAAGVATLTFVIGIAISYWLPEPKEELPE